MSVAYIKDNVLKIIAEELEEQEKEIDFPRQCFGTLTTKDMTALAIVYNGKPLKVIDIQSNLKLGREFDLLFIETEIGKVGIRRKWLNIEE